MIDRPDDKPDLGARPAAGASTHHPVLPAAQLRYRVIKNGNLDTLLHYTWREFIPDMFVDSRNDLSQSPG